MLFLVIYVHNMILPDNDDYRITGTDAGFAIIKKSHAKTNPSRHFHPYWELLYIVSGERTFFYANRTLHIEAGAFICIPPGVLHRALNPPEEICCLYNIYFENQSNLYFAGIESLLTAKEPCIELSPAIQEKVTQLFARIGMEMEEKNDGYIQLSWALIMEVLVTVRRQHSSRGILIRPSQIMNSYVSAAVDYINSHYSGSLSLASVAQRLHISASYLSREFHRATPFTFIEYVNSLRIMHACTLLKSGSLNVTAISEACGFGSITQFGRCFRSLTGKSPLEYRDFFYGKN